MNLEEQLSAVLNDPEAMNKISAIAGSLGLGAAAGSPPPQEEQPALPAGFSFPDIKGDNRAKLLMALKPFLSEKRAAYVDGAIALISVLTLGSRSGALNSLLSSLGGRSV